MGWRYWKNRHETMLINASNQYEQMLNQISQQNTDGAKVKLKHLWPTILLRLMLL